MYKNGFEHQNGDQTQNLGLQWNPKHLEIKTRSVEKTLEPLVMQVSIQCLHCEASVLTWLCFVLCNAFNLVTYRVSQG